MPARAPLTFAQRQATSARMAEPTLIIDLDAIAANWHALAALAPGATTGAVVKANAYGLGVEPVARRLASEGARRFFVATAGEGVRLRAALGTGPDIFVFSGHMAGDTGSVQAAGLIPLLNSPEQARRHLDALPGHPFGLQLDTGMSRLGFQPADFLAMRARLMAAGPALIMSHLACADAPDHPMNAAQLTAFRDLTDGLDAPRSLSATGGILMRPDYHFDLTRPGIGLYGGDPFAAAHRVVHLSIPVIQTRDLSPGDAVGYGASWRAARPTRLATIAAGYADGLIRAMGGTARVWADAAPCPIVGRVSMDLITVDITGLDDIPETLDILGPNQTIDDLARAAGTIGYEILTGLGARYARRYTGTAPGAPR